MSVIINSKKDIIPGIFARGEYGYSSMADKYLPYICSLNLHKAFQFPLFIVSGSSMPGSVYTGQASNIYRHTLKINNKKFISVKNEKSLSCNDLLYKKESPRSQPQFISLGKLINKYILTTLWS
jgi:hypothetical protein